MSGKRILVVEDDADSASILEAYLRRDGFEVILAEDGQRGIDLHHRHKPDLILLDMMLPRMSGTEVLTTVRRCSDTPVIMVTAMGDEPEKLGALRYGADDYVTVVGQNPLLTASTIVQRLGPQIAAIKLPPGYRIELGGEIEDSADANEALLQYLPHALIAIFLLFVWQFKSFRKLLIVVSSVPFVLIGVAVALLITGYPFGFMATFGLLSLAGIIINNAVLLLERIEVELTDGLSIHDSVVKAAVMRLRPIVMTKLTCIIGLVPLMLFAGPLWEGMAITIMGGGLRWERW